MQCRWCCVLNALGLSLFAYDCDEQLEKKGMTEQEKQNAEKYKKV